jgi:putative transposase
MDDSQRTFFITTVTRQRVPIFRVEARARLLIEMLLGYRDQGKYLLHEFVVMPDHIHLLLTPAGEVSLERAVQFIKGGYSYRLRKVEKIQVWQQSFTNHRLRDCDDYQKHCEYVRLNPVRAAGAGCGVVSVFVGECGVPVGCNATGAEAQFPQERLTRR